MKAEHMPELQYTNLCPVSQKLIGLDLKIPSKNFK